MTRPLSSRAEFIGLIAAIMMIVAFAIDSMLPALPAIGRSLHIANENRWSLVITAFMIGFGICQFFVGMVSDRYGRRGLLLAALVAYAGFSLLAGAATSFVLLLTARALQGLGAAGARVIAVSVVRDRFAGRDMAQVMSLASAIFMAAPIIAPFMGTAILAVAPWRWIFIVLAGVATLLFGWVALRLPETLAIERRRPISFRAVAAGARIVVGDRQSIAYSVANACLTVTVMGFLTSVQLVFSRTLHRGDLLPYGFAIMAATMMAASFLNAAIVKRFGMRRIGHSALVGLTLLAVLHAAVALTLGDTLINFVVLHSLMMACFAVAVGNFGAMAMENMGEVAGTASSLQGSFSTVAGALGGAAIGQSFNGTTVPLYVGVTIAGSIALGVILLAEGRLFVPLNPVARSA